MNDARAEPTEAGRRDLAAWRRWLLAAAGWAASFTPLSARGQDPAEAPAVPAVPAIPILNPNVPTPTFGGVQFWGDEHYFQGYRIQQNVFTGHHRLLDPGDVRRAWGTYEQCLARLQAIRAELQLPEMTGPMVVLVHGLGRSDKSLRRLQRHLEQQGYTVVGFNYPSTRCSLERSAEYLRSTINSLPPGGELHLVGFSLGGLVIRRYLAQEAEPRPGRVVFIGSPNLGADLATTLQKYWAFRIACGPAGQEIITGPDGAPMRLPRPAGEFAVIAGGRGTPKGYNPLIPGDDDTVVSFACTQLPGACDSAFVPTIHTLLNGDPRTLDFVARFLKEGRLRAEGDREPIPLPAEAPLEAP